MTQVPRRDGQGQAEARSKPVRRKAATKAGPGKGRGASVNDDGADTRAKLGEAFLEDLLAAWKSQGQTALSKVIESRPQDFFKVVAAMMPKDLTLNADPVGEMSDADLIARIKVLDAAIAPFLADSGDDADRREAEDPEP